MIDKIVDKINSTNETVTPNHQSLFLVNSSFNNFDILVSKKSTNTFTMNPSYHLIMQFFQ